MNIYPMHVSRSGKAGKKRPLINFQAPWLADMGFVPGALVQVLPEPGGLSLILCDENIQKYSVLYNETKAKNGELIVMSLYTRRRITFPGIHISSRCIAGTGLSIGDSLTARYEYGFIRARKLPVGAKIIPAGHERGTGKLVPKVRLAGSWLVDIGFVPGALATSEPQAGGGLIFRLQEGRGDNYGDLIKHARRNHMQLLQVYKEGTIPYVEATGLCLEKAGFAIGDAFIANFEYGVIHVVKPDFEQLGFY